MSGTYLGCGTAMSSLSGLTSLNYLPSKQPEIRYTKIKKEALPPIFASTGAAGADLHSVEDCVVPAKGKYLVSTGIQIALPDGYYGRIAPRSGLASKNFIDVGAGVIDTDYRGEIKVLLFNFSDDDYKISVGERIAQLICTSYIKPSIVEVTNLEATGQGYSTTRIGG